MKIPILLLSVLFTAEIVTARTVEYPKARKTDHTDEYFGTLVAVSLLILDYAFPGLGSGWY